MNSTASNTLKNADSRGLSSPGGGGGSSQGESELFTVYQSTYKGQSGAIAKVSTTGVIGKLVVWKVEAVTAVTAKLWNVHLL